jgi:hypothetical protein
MRPAYYQQQADYKIDDDDKKTKPVVLKQLLISTILRLRVLMGTVRSKSSCKRF